MAERVEAWWARRQFSRGADVPYAVGTYREAWAPFPMLIRQYHPELNAGITLTQIPPAADVLLVWQCESGHLFVATPSEQRDRPGRERRRSAWCPECAQLAKPPRIRPSGTTRPPRARPTRTLCEKTPALPVGEPFVSECAPRPASAVEAQLRADLFARLGVTPGCNAVKVSRPFFDHVEVWPDILLPELRIAVEYDSTGRFGLEHVGKREDADRRKDRALRAAHWEVVRVRTGKLEPLGPHDLQLASVGKRGVDRLLDAFRDIRGPLMVDAYLL
ncbi:Probable Zinc-ribbon domain-containing protein [Microbacterium sp. cf046]|uniref:zinc-ribbon domain-containing protein n=1 Tax=Microbacterium sp. cf046 TaxID=1761803 RepID=UPI0008DF1FC1|nr:zinc-ribbon domain-containing protein [Microbacterium sp. cf046]SFS17603.1 Probable Zinc-ribbon domain-containing protein [Microbacterium sp. cf046]